MLESGSEESSISHVDLPSLVYDAYFGAASAYNETVQDGLLRRKKNKAIRKRARRKSGKLERSGERLDQTAKVAEAANPAIKAGVNFPGDSEEGSGGKIETVRMCIARVASSLTAWRVDNTMADCICGVSRHSIPAATESADHDVKGSSDGMGACRRAYNAYLAERRDAKEQEEDRRCRAAYETIKAAKQTKCTLSKHMQQYTEPLQAESPKPKPAPRVRTWTGTEAARPKTVSACTAKRERSVKFDPYVKDDVDTVEVILDSGSDGHILPLSVMSRTREAPPGSCVKGMGGGSEPLTHAGYVDLLGGTAYAPKSGKFLVSLPLLDRKGCSIHIEKGKMRIYNKDGSLKL